MVAGLGLIEGGAIIAGRSNVIPSGPVVAKTYPFTSGNSYLLDAMRQKQLDITQHPLGEISGVLLGDQFIYGQILESNESRLVVRNIFTNEERVLLDRSGETSGHYFEDIRLVESRQSIIFRVTQIDEQHNWKTSIEQIDLEGNNHRVLTPENLDTIAYFEPSPDGKYLAYSGNTDEARFVRIMSLETYENLFELTQPLSPGEFPLPRYSPNGELLTFDMNFEGRDRIFLMQADGSCAHYIDMDVDLVDPVWSEDGESLTVMYDWRTNSFDYRTYQLQDLSLVSLRE